MGCDIHCFIEYRYKDGEPDYWNSFFANVNPGRCYRAFTLMAGVRGPRSQALFQPRGLPDKIGYMVSSAYWLLIRPDDKPEWTSWTDPKKAKEWVDYGLSVMSSKGNHACVSDPDVHTPSWLTTAEFERCIVEVERQFSLESPPPGMVMSYRIDPAYWAILGAMKALEEHGRIARLVFWFDN